MFLINPRSYSTTHCFFQLKDAFLGLQKLVHLDDNLRQKYDADLAQVETSVRETHKELEIVKDRVTRLEHEVRQLKKEAAQSKEDTFLQGTTHVLPLLV